MGMRGFKAQVSGDFQVLMTSSPASVTYLRIFSVLVQAQEGAADRFRGIASDITWRSHLKRPYWQGRDHRV
jgi:hypothetical protein